MLSKRPHCGCTHVKLSGHNLGYVRRAVIRHTLAAIGSDPNLLKPYWAQIKYAVSLTDPDERGYAYCFIRFQ